MAAGPIWAQMGSAGPRPADVAAVFDSDGRRAFLVLVRGARKPGASAPGMAAVIFSSVGDGRPAGWLWWIPGSIPQLARAASWEAWLPVKTGLDFVQAGDGGVYASLPS